MLLILKAMPGTGAMFAAMEVADLASIEKFGLAGVLALGNWLLLKGMGAKDKALNEAKDARIAALEAHIGKQDELLAKYRNEG